MDFFGIGPFEILLILLIAFIILGPQRLFDMSKKAGKVVGDLKRTASDLNDKMNEEIKETKPASTVDSKDNHVDGGSQQ
jgi:Tat protein translocase TatB subunit